MTVFGPFLRPPRLLGDDTVAKLEAAATRPYSLKEISLEAGAITGSAVVSGGLAWQFWSLATQYGLLLFETIAKTAGGPEKARPYLVVIPAATVVLFSIPTIITAWRMHVRNNRLKKESAAASEQLVRNRVETHDAFLVQAQLMNGPIADAGQREQAMIGYTAHGEHALVGDLNPGFLSPLTIVLQRTCSIITQGAGEIFGRVIPNPVRRLVERYRALHPPRPRG